MRILFDQQFSYRSRRGQAGGVTKKFEWFVSLRNLNINYYRRIPLSGKNEALTSTQAISPAAAPKHRGRDNWISEF